MNAQVIIIFAAVIAIVIAFGALSKLMEGAPPAWRRLRELFPSPIDAPGPGAREVRCFVFDTQDPRPRPIRVRCTTDDDSFDAWPVAVRSGGAMGVSIPWAGAELGHPTPTPMGPYVNLAIDGFTLLVPAVVVERELHTREELRRHAPPPAAHDPLVEEIT